MKSVKSTIVGLFCMFVGLATSTTTLAQTADQISKTTIDDYQKLTDAQKTTFKQNLTAVLKADTNFIKYNQMQQDNELAFFKRDKLKPLLSTHPKGKEEWIALYRQEGVSNPELYYQNVVASNKHLFAAVKTYPILARLDPASKMEILKNATVTPPEYYKELEKAVRPH